MADEEILPAGTIVRLTVEFALPAAASKSDIQDWVNLHWSAGGMSAANPLERHEPEALEEPDLCNTGYRLVERAVRVEDGERITRRRVRV